MGGAEAREVLKLSTLENLRFEITRPIEVSVEKQVLSSEIYSRCMYQRQVRLISSTRKPLSHAMNIRGDWQKGFLRSEDCQGSAKLRAVADQFWDRLATLTAEENTLLFIENQSFTFSKDSPTHF